MSTTVLINTLDNNLKSIPYDHSNETTKKEKKTNTAAAKDIIYSAYVYTPEALLANWVNISFFSISCSLIFYHVVQVRSIKMDPRISAFIAISLMLVSVGYNIIALPPYIARMNYAIKHVTVPHQKEGIYRLMLIYSGLIITTTIIQLVICYFILREVKKFL